MIFYCKHSLQKRMIHLHRREFTKIDQTFPVITHEFSPQRIAESPCLGQPGRSNFILCDVLVLWNRLHAFRTLPRAASRVCDRDTTMPDARVTLRRKSPYCTRSNRFKKIRTPGGKLTIQYVKKRGTVPKCGDTGAPLFGVAVRRPKELMRLSKPQKTVSRCYGGALSGKAVRNRYVFSLSFAIPWFDCVDSF